MTPARHFVGDSRAPVLTLDGAGPGDAARVVAMAAGLAPFPPAPNYYPGVRRLIDERDGDAWTYVVDLLRDATPYIAGAFDLDGFDLVEASFSLVTTPPRDLSPAQRAPHFDAVDPRVFAVLHYLAPCAGTAFYRHRATGIEQVTADNVDRFVPRAREDAQAAPADYIRDSGPAYDRIGHVEGLLGRLVAYPGRLLHSGIIPPDHAGSADPRTGRLTCNIFIRGRG